MTWADKYLRIPFRARGRDVAGCDCWGLVRLVYRQELGVELPDFAIDPNDAEAIPAAVAAEKPRWQAIPFDDRREFDVVVMRARLVVAGAAFSPDMHIGVVAPGGRILHTQEPFGVACVPHDHPTLVNRMSGIFRR